MTDHFLATDSSPPKQTGIKINHQERLLSAIFLGVMASVVCCLFIINPHFRSLYLLPLIALGFMAGYLVLPFFLSKNVRKPAISFLGSCLSTLVTSLLWFTIYAVSHYPTDANSNGRGSEPLEGLAFVFAYIGFITMIAAPIIGFLTLFFDKWLFNRRKRENAVNPEVFE